jgi:hypothetical protein
VAVFVWNFKPVNSDGFENMGNDNYNEKIKYIC